MDKKIAQLNDFGGRQTWASNFSGGQAWTRTIDYSGGYGAWDYSGAYFPFVDTANGYLHGQSVGYWYYGDIITHFVEPSTVNIKKGVIEGSLYGFVYSNYHTQSTSYNFLCSNAAYTVDNGYQSNIRNTNGLSFAITSYGAYHGSYCQVNAYLNGTLLGSLGTIATASLTYTINFRLAGSNLYASFGSGDLRGSLSGLPLISSTVDQSTLNGTNTVIWISGWCTNDQGQQLSEGVYSMNLTNYY